MSIASLLATSQAASVAAPSAAGTGTDFFLQMVPLLLVFVIFYVLMIRPQQARAKQHQATLAAVKKGDEVITGGGIRGRVTKVSDGEVEVEIATGIKVRAVTSTLNSVVTRDTKPAND
ncbi:preprotein translocase subunit YajC [Sphingomonas sp.]|uniref:preprotein translocase subunit YajC n=1 Tax=Sphingomonas sp. TaxID=28214 RepID=UPI0025F7A6DA|nr:preprotein translocase subunit YajC [Sphingomonas sp.]